jgi:ketosteroid isomerase-like protein
MESNVQIVQRAFQEFMRGNTAAVVDICSDDVTWGGFDNPGVPLAGTFKGKTGVKRFFSQIAELVDYSAFTPREFYGEGETVVVLGHHAGKVKKTGKTFDQDWAMVFRLRQSKIYSFFNFVDTRQQAEVFQEAFDLQRKETIPAASVKATR